MMSCGEEGPREKSVGTRVREKSVGPRVKSVGTGPMEKSVGTIVRRVCWR